MDLPIYLDIFKIKRVEVKTYFLKIEPVVCLNFITKIYGHDNIFTISYDRFIGNVLDNFISATSLMKRSPDKPLTLMNELIPGGLTCNLIKPPYNRTFMDLRTYIMTSKSDNKKIRKRLCDNPNPNETSVFLSRNGISLTYTECLTFLLHIHILDEKVKLHKKRIKEEENVVKQEKIDALVKYFDENDSRPLKKFKKDIHDLLIDVRSNYK